MIVATLERKNEQIQFHREASYVFDTVEEFRNEITNPDFNTIVRRVWELKEDAPTKIHSEETKDAVSIKALEEWISTKAKDYSGHCSSFENVCKMDVLEELREYLSKNCV